MSPSVILGVGQLPSPRGFSFFLGVVIVVQVLSLYVQASRSGRPIVLASSGRLESCTDERHNQTLVLSQLDF